LSKIKSQKEVVGIRIFLTIFVLCRLSESDTSLWTDYTPIVYYEVGGRKVGSGRATSSGSLRHQPEEGGGYRGGYYTDDHYRDWNGNATFILYEISPRFGDSFRAFIAQKTFVVFFRDFSSSCNLVAKMIQKVHPGSRS
jgi:hypothetical protein